MYNQYVMKKPVFTIEGSLVIVTGANRGIGREAARKLSEAGADVVIACRNPEKASGAADEIGRVSHNPVNFMTADMSDLLSIRKFSERFLDKYGTPDVLVNNAAVYMRKYIKTDFGMEMTHAVNYLAPFYLANLFLPHMASLEGETRIVNVTSDSYYVKDFDPELKNRKKYVGFNAYSQSKRALMYFTFELAEKVNKTDVTVNCVDPGHASTGIWPSDVLHWKIAGKIVSLFADPPSYAAENVFHAASSEKLMKVTGKYLKDLRVTTTREGMFEKDISDRLWEETLDYLSDKI